MKYLIVDGMISGTGLRDAVDGGYLELTELCISKELRRKLSNWHYRYQKAHYTKFEDKAMVANLDAEGIEITKLLCDEVSGVKIAYFSAAEMKKFAI